MKRQPMCLGGTSREPVKRRIRDFYSFRLLRNTDEARPSRSHGRQLNCLDAIIEGASGRSSMHLIQCSIIEFRSPLFLPLDGAVTTSQLVLIDATTIWLRDLNYPHRFFPFVRWKSFETKMQLLVSSSQQFITFRPRFFLLLFAATSQLDAFNLVLNHDCETTHITHPHAHDSHCQLVYSKTNFPLDNYKKITFYRFCVRSLPLASGFPLPASRYLLHQIRESNKNWKKKVLWCGG